jgi:hypothetical protein
MLQPSESAQNFKLVERVSKSCRAVAGIELPEWPLNNFNINRSQKCLDVESVCENRSGIIGVHQVPPLRIR